MTQHMEHEGGMQTFAAFGIDGSYTQESKVCKVERLKKPAKVLYCNNHEQLRTHLSDFTAANNCVGRLKAPSNFTPCQNICKTGHPSLIDPS